MTSIFEYRGLIWNFIKRDISSKYVGSLLGLYWSVINPIITLVVYIIVFGVFLNVRLPGSYQYLGFCIVFRCRVSSLAGIPGFRDAGITIDYR